MSEFLKRVIIWRACWRTVKKRWRLRHSLAAASSLLLILMFYLGWSLFRVSRAELAAAELKTSWLQEPICREDCQRWRLERVDILVAALQANQSRSRLQSLLTTYFQDASISREFKQEVLRIWRLAYGPDNPPLILSDYLLKEAGDPYLQAAIVAAFSPKALSLRQAEATGGLSLSQTEFGLPAGPLSYYFDLLLGPDDWPVKLAAVRALSDYREQAADFSLSQLPIFGEIIKSGDTDKRLRQALVMLLADYYQFYPEDSASIWRAVYRSDKADEISRVLAADFLQRLELAALAAGGEPSYELQEQARLAWPTPAVSLDAWADYYQNK